MVEFSSKIAGRDIIASGSIVSGSGDDTLYFKIANLELRIIFEATEDKKSEVVAEIADDTSLLLRLKNFTNSLGTYWSAEIGTIQNRRLHIALAIYMASSEKPVRSINYTLSLGEAVDGK